MCHYTRAVITGRQGRGGKKVRETERTIARRRGGGAFPEGNYTFGCRGSDFYHYIQLCTGGESKCRRFVRCTHTHTHVYL